MILSILLLELATSNDRIREGYDKGHLGWKKTEEQHIDGALAHVLAYHVSEHYGLERMKGCGKTLEGVPGVSWWVQYVIPLVG